MEGRLKLSEAIIELFKRVRRIEIILAILLTIALTNSGINLLALL